MIKQLNRKQWIAIAALILVVMVTGLFAVRTFRRAIYWRMHRAAVIRPWMSLPYVAHSYRVPPHVLYDAQEVEHPPHDRRPVQQLAKEQNRPVNDLIKALSHAIGR